MPAMEIERIGVADFADAERAGRPAVIAGGATCRATELWSPSYLAAKLGHVAIRYKRSTRNCHPNFHAATIAEMFAVGACTFGEFLDHITRGPEDHRAHWLFTGDEQFIVQRRNDVTTEHPELRALLEDLDPSLVPAERLYTVWGWFSGRGVRTWLHYDNNGCHNLNFTITGRKHCRLYAPELLARLAPFPLGGANPAHNCSAIDVDDPPPGFAELPALEATLEAGDALFIPAWWFHTFLHLGELNSNINYWWRPERPLANPTARRQDVLDLARATGVDPKTDAGAVLRQLDALAIALQ